MPRTGFFATTGRTVFDKIGNFLFHSDNAVYAWALLLGVAGVAFCGCCSCAACSPWSASANAWPIQSLFALWTGFILAANGPVASPKYRLPIEPVLCVLSGAGFALLRGRRT